MKRESLIAAALLALAAPSFAQSTPPATQPAPEPPPSNRPVSEYETMPVADLVARADALLAERNVAEAESAIGFALLRERNNVTALTIAGELSLLRSDPESARRFFLDAIAVQKNDFRANLGMGTLWVAKRNWRQAREYLAVAASVAPAERAAEVLVLLAQAYGGSSLATLALETAERAVQLAPQNYEARQTLVLLRASAGEFESAITETRPLLELAQAEAAKTPVTSAGLRRLRDAYEIKLTVLRNYQSQRYFVRNPDGTISDRVASGKEADSAAILTQMIDVLALQIELDRRIAYFVGLTLAERMVELDPNKPAYWLQLGLLRKHTFNPDDAAQAFRRALEIEPDNADARRELDAMEAGTPANQ